MQGQLQIKTHPEHLEYYKTFLKIERLTRTFLEKRGYLPLHLPLLSPALVPESYLEIFKSEYRYLGTRQELFLTPSPELFIKRLLSQNIGDCYYLGKSFRNEERNSDKHASEFTMLEFYKVNAGYNDIADEVLALFQSLAATLPDKTLRYNGYEVRFTQWEKLTVDQAFVIYAHLSPGDVFDEKKLINAAKLKDYEVDNFSYEDVFSQMYVQEVEPQLGTHGYPTLLTDYPKAFAALAKMNKDNKTAQRFEVYIAGVEIGDCYSELTNADEQKQRFHDEDKKRNYAKRIKHPVDWGMVSALEDGLPECSGIAIGFDRLAMVFAGAPSIHNLRIVDVTD